MRNVALEGAVSMPDNSLSLIYKLHCSHCGRKLFLATLPQMQNARCEFIFTFLVVSRFSCLPWEFGGLMPGPAHMHLLSMSPPAAAVGISSPSVWCPTSCPMRVFLTSQSILDGPGCPCASPSAQLSQDQIVKLPGKFLPWQCHFSWVVIAFCSCQY